MTNSWQHMERDTRPHGYQTPPGFWENSMKQAKELNGGHEVSKAKIKKLLRKISNKEKWVNNLYKVDVDRRHRHPLMERLGFSIGQIIELGITRHDGSAIHDWRHLQYIKNDVLGNDVEAVELFPKESRLMDTANTFWLYAIVDYDFPFGFTMRNINDEIESAKVGAMQRPFDEDLE